LLRGLEKKEKEGEKEKDLRASMQKREIGRRETTQDDGKE